jgi:hypothetical protein
MFSPLKLSVIMLSVANLILVLSVYLLNVAILRLFTLCHNPEY